MKFYWYLTNVNQSLSIHNCLIWFVCFFIDFDKKVFIIKVTLKKISFCLKPSKSEVVTLVVKNFRKFLFQNSCVQTTSAKKWDKVSIYAFSNFIIFSLFQCTTWVYFMSFVFYNLHKKNLSNDIVSTIKQPCIWCMFSFITLANAKTWAYELNSDFKNKSKWTLCQLWIKIWTNRLGLWNLHFQGKQNHIIHKPVSTIY